MWSILCKLYFLRLIHLGHISKAESDFNEDIINFRKPDFFPWRESLQNFKEIKNISFISTLIADLNRVFIRKWIKSNKIKSNKCINRINNV